MQGSNPLSAAAIDEIRRHPDFLAAMRRAAAGFVALRQHHRLAGWLLSDRALAILHHVALCMDAQGDEDDPRAGLTPSRFKAFCSERGYCSPGRAAAILAIMRASGMLHATSSAVDRRVVRLRPTERLREAARARLTVQLEAFSPLRPSLADASTRLGCRTFEREYYRAFAAMLNPDLGVMEHIADLQPFIERDAGMLILFALLAGAEEAGDGADAPLAELSIAALARRLGTSRAQVLRVVREAESAGLIARTGPRSSTVQLAPLLVELLETFFAAILHVISHCAETGLRAAPVCTCQAACPQ
jgi:transposase-like protein